VITLVSTTTSKTDAVLAKSEEAIPKPGVASDLEIPGAISSLYVETGLPLLNL